MNLVSVDFFLRVLKHIEQTVHRDAKPVAQTHHMVGHFFVQFPVSAQSDYAFPLRESLSPTWDRLNEEKALNVQSFGAGMHQTNVFLILPQRPDFAFLWRHFIVEGKQLCIRGLDPVVFRGDRKLWCVRGVAPQSRAHSINRYVGEIRHLEDGMTGGESVEVGVQLERGHGERSCGDTGVLALNGLEIEVGGLFESPSRVDHIVLVEAVEGDDSGKNIRVKSEKNVLVRLFPCSPAAVKNDEPVETITGELRIKNTLERAFFFSVIPDKLSGHRATGDEYHTGQRPCTVRHPFP